MGVLGWLVASALCAAVRGESVPRDGAEAPGGFGGAPKLGDPPRVSSPRRWVNGNAGQDGEGFLIGCARPRARSPWERRAAGWCSALKAWQGGEDENRATPSQTALTHAPTPAISLFLQRESSGGRRAGCCRKRWGGQGEPCPPLPLAGCLGHCASPGGAGSIAAPCVLGTTCGCPDLWEPPDFGVLGPVRKVLTEGKAGSQGVLAWGCTSCEPGRSRRERERPAAGCPAAPQPGPSPACALQDRTRGSPGRCPTSDPSTMSEVTAPCRG